MQTLGFVLGTRPEIIKLAPLLRRVVEQKIPFQLVHTNQHYDHAMDGIFFDELKLSAPHHSLHAAAPSPAIFLANVFRGLDQIWSKDRPSVVIAQGDTNTVLAAALVAEKSRLPFAHVEAGLRSDDRAMPEEINRILADSIGTRLYVPTEYQMMRLRHEGIRSARMFLTGNTIADAVREHLPLARLTSLPADLSRFSTQYALITLHRPSLVDHPELLKAVLQRISDTLQQSKIQGVFLAHPRTKKTLDAIGFSSKSIVVHDPVGYLPMLRLLSGATLLITDSGGLQEEAAILKVRCVTLRTTTERPETLDAGGNILVAPDDETLLSQCTGLLSSNIDWKTLYSCPNPSDTILSDLLTHFT